MSFCLIYLKWFLWQYTDTNEWLWQWPLFLYNKLKQGISCRTRYETSSCNESQHFGRCCSFLRPLDGHSMNRFKKLWVMNLFRYNWVERFIGSERFPSPSLVPPHNDAYNTWPCSHIHIFPPGAFLFSGKYAWLIGSENGNGLIQLKMLCLMVMIHLEVMFK